MAHVRKGDTVVVTKGREKGKRGTVKRLTKNGRVEIEKVMMVKRHTKPSQSNPQGGIRDIEGTVALSNVSLWCDKCNAARRSKALIDASGPTVKKDRACVKCGAVFTRTLK